MDNEYERHTFKLQSIGYKDGFFEGLESIEKQTLESLGYIVGAKSYTFLRVLVEVYVAGQTRDGSTLLTNTTSSGLEKISEKELKKLLDIHTFSPDKLQSNFGFTLNSFKDWNVFSCLTRLLSDGKVSDVDSVFVAKFGSHPVVATLLEYVKNRNAFIYTKN